MIRFLLALLILAFAPLTAATAAEDGKAYRWPLVIETQAGERHVFDIEIARTRREMMQGLMHRTELDTYAGMLFAFDRESELSFWMKNTLIPLDLLFIRENGSIHHIHANAVPLDLTPIPSNGPAKAVLEINGGMAEELNIKPGDIIIHPFFGNTLAE